MPPPSRPLESFDEWLATPLAPGSEDPRFAVRRAGFADFERIFDAVDDAFGVKRPRALYDWLYRKSPLGPARCWILLENATQAVVNVTALVPWPLARRGTPIEGALVADSATIRRFQRQDISLLRRSRRIQDPWQRRAAQISWPNETSRARAAKRGYARFNLGPLPRWVLPLRASSQLQQRYGLARPLAAVAGAVLDVSLGLGRAPQIAGRRVHVEEIAAFDAGFDAVTWDDLAGPAFCSPHDAEFLNWRYRAHPEQEYACAAASEGSDPCGYAVVRVAPPRAVLMELVCSRGPRVSRALLRWAARTARDAGCTQLDFETTCAQPYAAPLRRAGFLAAPSSLYVTALPPRTPPEPTSLEDWRLVPGDQDAL